MAIRYHPVDCAACGKTVLPAAGLYRCVCGWTPKSNFEVDQFRYRPPRYPDYDRQTPEPVDHFFKRHTP